MILAGGLGERLLPLTESIPKALACIDGQPIIHSQIENLCSLGFSEVIILTGYRSEMIDSYIKSCKHEFQCNIQVISSPVGFSPAERLLDSRSIIGDNFLLVYCDNLVDDMATLRSVIKSSTPLTFFAEKRDSGNLTIEPTTKYFLRRSKESPFVELGYLQVCTPLFFELLNSKLTVQEALANISEQDVCSTKVTSDKLKSVSNISRFNELRANRKTILIDRDGILNVKMPHREYLSRWEDYVPLHKNIEYLSRELSQDTDFIIITNQPGIATGEVAPDFLDDLHSKLIVDLLSLKISVIGIYVCKHHWEDNCECRKPKPGMILKAIQDYKLNPVKLVYIGDELKDMQASTAAGVRGIQVSTDSTIGSFYSLEGAFSTIQKQISM